MHRAMEQSENDFDRYTGRRRCISLDYFDERIHCGASERRGEDRAFCFDPE